MNIQNKILLFSIFACSILNASNEKMTATNGIYSYRFNHDTYGVLVTENKKYDLLDIYDLSKNRSLTTQNGHSSCVQMDENSGMYIFYPVQWCSYLKQFKDKFYEKKDAYVAKEVLKEKKDTQAPAVLKYQDPAVSKYLNEWKQYQNYLRKIFPTHNS